MPDSLAAEDLRALAQQHGLSLSAADAQDALAGAQRARRAAEQLRGLVTRDLEPAPAFRVPGGEPTHARG